MPAAVRAALQPTGYRIHLGDSVYCDIWLAQSVAATGAKEAKEAIYSQLPPSAFAGVISFPSGAKDFRGQSIKPGYYTLRYQLMPADGNHLGVAPNPDFLLLVPAALDPNPAAAFPYEQFVKLSAQAAGTNHPAVFLMPSPEAGDLPKVFQNADGFYVFAAKLRTSASGELPFALVIKGEAQ